MENSEPPINSQAEVVQPDANEQKQKEDNMGFLTRRWQWVKDPNHASAVVAIFTFIIALTGIIYAVFAGLQWHATVQVMRLDQRPWIVPKSGGQLQLQIGQPIARPLYVQNTGKTAAFIFRMEIVKEGDEPAFDLSPPHISKINTPVEWQGESTPSLNLLILEAPTKPVLSTQDLSDRFTRRTIMFLTYGRITYDDMWGIHHLTTACQSFKAPDPSGVIYTGSKAEVKCTAYTSVDTNY